MVMNEKTHKENFKKIKDDIKKEVESNPQHKSDKVQAHAAGGLGITGMLGCAGAEALELIGGHVTEIVGGGTGIGIILFFLFKFFAIEMEELH